MSRSRTIYYVFFPCVTAGLCAFSYYLGLHRGKQVALDVPSVIDSIPGQETPHPPQEELTFFKTLNEKEAPLVLADVTPEAPVSPPSRPSGVLKTAKKGGGFAKKGEEGSVVIQMSAFRDIGKADELTDSLRNRGFSAYTETTRKGGVSWHRVFVGPFKTRPDADGVSSQLVEKGFPSGFVTNRSK